MAEYSQKWNNRTSRTRSTETSDGLAAIQAQLNNLGREIMKVNEKVYAAQVGCELWQYREAALGFYQRNNANPSYQEQRQSMEESLSNFMNESAKRHEENSKLIKEIRASMNTAIRNQGASIKALEIQIGQISKVLQEKGSGSLPSLTETNLRDHVNSISTTVEADTTPIRRIGSTQYIVSAQQNSKLIFESRQATISFPCRLNDYYYDEKRSYRPQYLDAYSYGATRLDDSWPRKENDPRSFTLPCYINNVCFEKALADLGSSVSVMPLSTYLNLGLGNLAHTKLTVELADRTVKYPKGIVENVLVGIDKFVFPVDFIILDMSEDVKVPLILGRPFLSTAHAKIDVFKRKITLRVGDEKIIFKSVKNASSLIKRVYMLSDSSKTYREMITSQLQRKLWLYDEFWQTASASTSENGEIKITATIDGRAKIVTEASIRRHLNLEDSDGISTLPNTEIFEQLALMGAQFFRVKDQQSQLKKAATMPHDSPLPRVYSLRSDKGSMTLHELTVLCTTLSKKVGSLESDLKQTKLTYGAAYTKLIMKVKKLENKIKSSKARRRVRLIVSEDECDLEDPPKQGMKIAQLDEDERITLFTAPEEVYTAEHDISTTNVPVSTAGAEVSTARPEVKTSAKILAYIRRGAAKRKDKGKAIMKEVEHIKELFETLMKRVKDFVPMESDRLVPKISTGSYKRTTETELDHEGSKRQKTNEEQSAEEEKELSEEELQKLMMIVLVEEVYVEALQVKYPIIDWENYQKRFSSTDPTNDKERALWVELKRLFELDIDDILWKLQRYMHDPLTWRLYDTCGVHHVSTDRGHDIFMLVEKDYPLTRGLLTLMMCNKLQVD
ncbi:mitochondrial proton/calcium exchanger protein-like protein isoform X1 [Tanacetum coccineum]